VKTLTDRRRLVVLVLLSILSLGGRYSSLPADAAIYRWGTGELITDRDAVPGADLSEMNLRWADLSGASLSHADFEYSDLTSAFLTEADLSGANLRYATLAFAWLHGAVVTDADLSGTSGRGFTAGQLYSTASYHSGNLGGIGLGGNDLSGSNFAGKNLADASFEAATLTDANLSGATLTRANLELAALGNADFSRANLANTNLHGATLWDAGLSGANLTSAYCMCATFRRTNLSGADLTNASFCLADLRDADLSGAVVTGANFCDSAFDGFTAAQLYSTANYQEGNLWGVGLGGNDLSGWDFAEKDLTDADFENATLTAADFRQAVVPGADFGRTTLTIEQLYSTASYQSGDLSRIRLGYDDLTGWDFAGKNLSGASFGSATLTDTDFSGAVVTRAYFGGTTDSGFTPEQLYSTASYRAGDLSGIGLNGNDLSKWSFAEQNLRDASFYKATLTDTDFSKAVVTGADFGHTTDRGFTAAQLYSTASYQSGDLGDIELDHNDLSGWNLARQNLTGGDFRLATLTDTDFSGAVIRGAYFAYTTRGGFTAAQLYSTASYQSGNLGAIVLGDNDLSGWDFAEKNLTNAAFWRVTLTNADFTGANLTDANFGSASLIDANLSLCDLRGARILPTQISSAASSENAILPDGRIEGLALDATAKLVLRDYNPSGTLWTPEPPMPIPITVESGMSLNPESTLRMIFEDDDWGSTISFEPGIDVALGGTLELLFADGVDPGALIGTMFGLFDWDGANVTGRFDHVVTESGAIWDTSDLYTTGQVTLVPEPSTLLLLLIAVAAGVCIRHL